MNNEYLAWMAENTETQWCNDSANFAEIEDAIKHNSIGVTTNPPLSYGALTEYADEFKADVDKIDGSLSADERVLALMSLVVKKIGGMVKPIYDKTDGKFGYVRAQVKPKDFQDKDAMLAAGKEMATWVENLKVKIPGSKAGIWVLEELAALGIATNPTVCVSLSQILAAAEANERGAKRAEEAGITPAPSSAAFVMGRLQDYLTALNEERNLGLPKTDLDEAALAVCKRCYTIMKERGYKQTLMPAAFRCSRQVTELAGGDMEMTIHPKVQKMVCEAYESGEAKKEVRIDAPVDEDAVARVAKAIPEYALAYDVDGLSLDEFDTFGATTMTLDGFDKTGWQKLLEL